MDKMQGIAAAFMPEILSTKHFKKNFFECIQRNPIMLRIASPFIGALPAYDSVIRFAQYLLRHDEVSFQLITCPPSTVENGIITPFVADTIEKLGVDLVIRHKPKLHSKVYLFKFPQGDSVSFVGSANFTKGGLEINDETVAMFRDPVVNKKVEDELNRLSSYGSDKYTAWKIKNFKNCVGGR